jgi:hypothetical protein
MMQVIVHAAVDPLTRLTTVGTSVLVKGELGHPLVSAREAIKLRVERVIEVGEVITVTYLLPKGRIGLAMLQDFIHLCHTPTYTQMLFLSCVCQIVLSINIIIFHSCVLSEADVA